MSLTNLLAQQRAGQDGQHITRTLQAYFQKLGVPPDRAIAGVQKEVAEGLKLIPFESSVMGVKMLGDGVAQIHFFTIGSAKDLVDDMQYFYKYMKDRGIRVVYDRAPDPLTTAGLQRLGAQIMQSDNPKYKFKAAI